MTLYLRFALQADSGLLDESRAFSFLVDGVDIELHQEGPHSGQSVPLAISARTKIELSAKEASAIASAIEGHVPRGVNLDDWTQLTLGLGSPLAKVGDAIPPNVLLHRSLFGAAFAKQINDAEKRAVSATERALRILQNSVAPQWATT